MANNKSAVQDKNLLWEKYKHEIELHRGYMDLAIKLNLFFYAITGAIVSFYFLHIGEKPLLKWSLVLPFFMSVSFALFFFFSARSTSATNDEILRICKELDLPVYSLIAEVLKWLLYIFFSLMIISAVGLLMAFFKDADFSCLLG